MTIFPNIWDAIGDTPEGADDLRRRSALMIEIRGRIKASGWSQTEAAKRLGVTERRIADLMRGKIDKFGLDTLVNMLERSDGWKRPDESVAMHYRREQVAKEMAAVHEAFEKSGKDRK